MARNKGSLIENLLSDEDWKKAQKVLLRELRKSPGNAWLLTRLSQAYFGDGDYKRALKASEKAYAVAPDEPLVLWDYAEALYMLRQWPFSLKLFRRILAKKIDTLLNARYGARWAKALRNACRFKIGVCYIQINKLGFAIQWLEKYLSNSGRGIANWYSTDEVRRILERVVQLKSRIDKNRARLWVSLLEVEVLSGRTHSKYTKGFTNGLVMGRSAKEAIAVFERELSNIGYKLIRAEDTEEFEKRCLNVEVDDELRNLASAAEREHIAKFGTFCMYPAHK